MSALAQLLEVDLGWLTLGTKPEMTPKERKARNAVADGAVNLVAAVRESFYATSVLVVQHFID